MANHFAAITTGALSVTAPTVNDVAVGIATRYRSSRLGRQFILQVLGEILRSLLQLQERRPFGAGLGREMQRDRDELVIILRAPSTR